MHAVALTWAMPMRHYMFHGCAILRRSILPLSCKPMYTLTSCDRQVYSHRAQLFKNHGSLEAVTLHHVVRSITSLACIRKKRCNIATGASHSIQPWNISLPGHSRAESHARTRRLQTRTLGELQSRTAAAPALTPQRLWAQSQTMRQYATGIC
jgi:hypothetical protein